MTSFPGGNMQKITISEPKKYDILIGSGLLSDCGRRIREVCDARRALVVCGDIVEGLYLDTVLQSLEDAGIGAGAFVYKNGEKSKNLDTYGRILKAMAALELSRSDLVIALGGGVTGDMAAFAAATYMRGCGLVHMPTTLLGMVDSCFGGKCGVDLPRGKNMVGTFYEPVLTLCDIDTLITLPPERLSEGWAEIVKYGVLCAPELLARDETDLEKLVSDCLCIKNDYVSGDREDHGRRRFLNLGHTVAHAIEEYSGYSVSHGQAVAMGLSVMTHGDERVCAALKGHGLPTECPYPANELCKLMINDKKRSGDTITLVVPRSIGYCELVEVKVTELESFLFGGENG